MAKKLFGEMTLWAKENCPDCSPIIKLLQDNDVEHVVKPAVRMGEGRLGRLVIRQFAKQRKRLPIIKVDGEFVDPADLEALVQKKLSEQ